MADVFELELHDLQEDDPNRAPDSDDDIIEVDEVNIPYFIHTFIRNLFISLHRQCECAARAKKFRFTTKSRSQLNFGLTQILSILPFLHLIFSKRPEREKKNIEQITKNLKRAQFIPVNVWVCTDKRQRFKIHFYF